VKVIYSWKLFRKFPTQLRNLPFAERSIKTFLSYFSTLCVIWSWAHWTTETLIKNLPKKRMLTSVLNTKWWNISLANCSRKLNFKLSKLIFSFKIFMILARTWQFLLTILMLFIFKSRWGWIKRSVNVL